MEYVSLKGARVPAIGLGTWPMSGGECVRAVASALAMGYRHIDTAQMYGNEAEVGRGIRQSGIAREELWLTTKLWRDSLKARDVRRSIEGRLSQLGSSYIDLLLIHWPDPATPLRETLDAMAEAQAAGHVRYIGVSNFPVKLMAEAVETIGADILANQVEYHPLLSQKRVTAYARAHGLMVIAYCPLARGRLADHPPVVAIARQHGKTAEQVALRWLIQQEGVVAIPKATGVAHQQANLDVFDFRLSADEMAAIHAAAGNQRLINVSGGTPWDPE